MKNFRLPSIAPQHATLLAIIWLSLICLLVVTTQASESGAEAYLRWVTMFSFWMNSALLMFFIAVVVSFIVHNFGKGIKIAYTWGYETPGPALGDGLNLGIDLAIFSQNPDDVGEDLKDRWEQARNKATNLKWAVFIPFRQPTGFVFKLSGIAFTRDNPPYQGPDWPEKISPVGFNYMQETWEEYQDYIKTFCAHFPQWAATTKVLTAGSNAAATAGNLLSMACMLLLFALPVSLSAQKSEQVRQYLGDVRYNSAPDKGTVKFVFKKVVLSRVSDGSRTYKDILPSDQYYTDEQNAGALLAIQVFDSKAWQIIQPEQKRNEQPKQTTAVNAEVQSAKPVPPIYALHDSADVARNVDAGKRMFDDMRKSFWTEIKPYWGFVTYVMGFLTIPIMLIGGILWYICSTAAMESAINLYGVPVVGRWIYSIHQGSASILLLILWVETVFILINVFLWFVYKDWPTWVMFMLWAAVLGIAKKITNRLVPNVQVVGGGGSRVVGGGYRALNQ